MGVLGGDAVLHARAPQALIALAFWPLPSLSLVLLFSRLHDEHHSYTGRNFYYGIREHAMGSILNGIAYFGLHRCSGSTFLVFADYMRAPMRVAALSELPINYILTHDSIGVGEVRREGFPCRKALGFRFSILPLCAFRLQGQGGENEGGGATVSIALVSAELRLFPPSFLPLRRGRVPYRSRSRSDEANVGQVGALLYHRMAPCGRVWCGVFEGRTGGRV